MRSIIFAALVALAGCGDDANHEPIPDLSTGNPCPSGAEQLRGATCKYGVDTTCRSPHGYDCSCLCTGYWECDQVKVVCDPDGGTAHD